MASETQNIYLESSILQSMRQDANAVLQKLIKTMSEKGSDSGEMTIKLKLEYVPEFVSDGKNGSRRAVKPKFQHTISSKMEVKDSKNGEEYDDLREVVYDPDQDRYVLKPIKGSEQMNIFELMDGKEDEDKDENRIVGDENPCEIPMLQPPAEEVVDEEVAEVVDEENIIDGDYTEVSDVPEQSSNAPDPAEAEAPSEFDDYDYDDELIEDEEMEMAWQ